MICEVMRMGEKVLMQVASALPRELFGSTELRLLVEDLWDTMKKEGGVGIAAPQIGRSLQVICFGFENSDRYPGAPSVPNTVLINPVITPLSEDKEGGWEGCLSVPGMRGWVPRYTSIRYEGFDIEGNRLVREAQGFHARVVQHETDHLNGFVYPMRVQDWTKFGFSDVLFPELEDKR